MLYKANIHLCLKDFDNKEMKQKLEAKEMKFSTKKKKSNIYLDMPESQMKLSVSLQNTEN